MTKIASDEKMESLYKLRIRESDQLKSALDLYDLDIHLKKSNPDYQKLKTVVKRSIDQKLRLRNFDARLGKIESGAVGKSREGAVGVETQDRAQKPEHTAATLSEPALSRGGSVSGKKSIRGKSNHGSIARQPCRYYLKGAYLHANFL